MSILLLRSFVQPVSLLESHLLFQIPDLLLQVVVFSYQIVLIGFMFFSVLAYFDSSICDVLLEFSSFGLAFSEISSGCIYFFVAIVYHFNLFIQGYHSCFQVFYLNIFLIQRVLKLLLSQSVLN